MILSLLSSSPPPFPLPEQGSSFYGKRFLPFRLQGHLYTAAEISIPEPVLGQIIAEGIRQNLYASHDLIAITVHNAIFRQLFLTCLFQAGRH